MTSITTDDSLVLRGSHLDHSHVLRALEQLRRHVARRVYGSDGLFIGYDVLDLRPMPNTADEAVLCSAKVTKKSAHVLDVSYTATLVDNAALDSSAGELLCFGTGRTVVPAMRGVQ